MGILVICSYRPKPGQEDEARALMAAHVPLLRRHKLITERPVVQGVAADGALIEVFEWASEAASRGAPAIPEVGAHWKKMAEAMDFVPLSSLGEAQHPFAHFTPV